MAARIDADKATALMGRIAAAKAARLAAEATEEQAVRDAVADGLSPSRAAAALSTSNRQRVYAILGRGPDGAKPEPPMAPTAVYVRGAGVTQDSWDRIIDALHARGLMVIRDRTQAWHLARGGIRVILCDFSSGELAGRSVRVGRVRARWDVTTGWRAIEDIATTAHAAQMHHDRSPLIGQSVEVENSEMDLTLISGGPIGRPERRLEDGGLVLDEQAIARAVAAELD